jgi:hypothetical protein
VIILAVNTSVSIRRRIGGWRRRGGVRRFGNEAFHEEAHGSTRTRWNVTKMRGLVHRCIVGRSYVPQSQSCTTHFPIPVQIVQELSDCHCQPQPRKVKNWHTLQLPKKRGRCILKVPACNCRIYCNETDLPPLWICLLRSLQQQLTFWARDRRARLLLATPVYLHLAPAPFYSSQHASNV